MFFNVLSQVAMLFIMMFLGVLLTKTKVLNEAAVRSVTDLVLYVVTPCVIIKSFIREFDKSAFKSLMLSFAIAFAVHIALIIITLIALPDKNRARRSVLQFATIFSNCGYMALPLQQAILGDDGVFFGASFIAVFNIITWTYGVALMSGDKGNITLKKLVLNPGVIGITVGLIIFFGSIPLPGIIAEPIGYMAALNTPLPMIIIGYHLTKSNVLECFKDLKCLWAVALRLIIAPLAALGIMYALGIRGVLLTSSVISCCAPTAANTTMFAAKYNSDVPLSVSMVSLSTLLSLITIPLIVSLAQSIA